MGKIFFWMSLPDPGIPETVWSEFLNGMAAWMMVTSFITTGVVLALYAWAAHRKKVRFPADLFSIYTPAWWIALAVPAGAVVVWAGVWQYPLVLNTDVGKYGVALEIGFMTTGLTLIVAYLLMAFIPGITPVKYIYRLIPFRNRRKAIGG